MQLCWIRPSASAAILVGDLAGKLRMNPVKLAQPFLKLGFLLLQQFDLLKTLLAAERQRLGVGIALLDCNHLANLAQSETELLALEDQAKPGAITLRIEPVQAVALRRQQTLVLVEAQCAQRDAKFA